MKTNLRQFCFCAVFTALCAVCAQIQIPLPMVPINLALFAVHLAGALLGAKRGVAAVAAYVMLGALGAPVFAGFAGGVQVIMGKTGGYLLGYLIAALLVGLLRARWGIGYWRLCFAMTLGTAGCYFFGTVWFMAVTGTGIWTSLVYCVFPFLAGDALKIALAAYLTRRLATRNANIFPAIRRTIRRISIACSAIARFMRLATNAAGISPIRKTASRTAAIA